MGAGWDGGFSWLGQRGLQRGSWLGRLTAGWTRASVGWVNEGLGLSVGAGWDASAGWDKVEPRGPWELRGACTQMIRSR